MARDVRACRSFWEDGFGLRTFEIIRREDDSEDGAWLSSTFRTYGTPGTGAPEESLTADWPSAAGLGQ
jgi:hypothetical protein